MAATERSDPELVRGSELLAGLDSEQGKRLCALASHQHVKAGEPIFRIGDPAASLFMIATGHVELTVPLRVMGEVKDVVFQVLEAGRVLAWSALVPPHQLTMGARALTDAELLILPRQDLLRLFEAEPWICGRVMANLARVIGGRLHEAQALWIREVQRHVAQAYR